MAEVPCFVVMDNQYDRSGVSHDPYVVYLTDAEARKFVEQENKRLKDRKIYDEDYTVESCVIEMDATHRAAHDLLASLKELKAMLGPDGEFAICLANGTMMGICDAIRAGDVLERASAAIDKAEQD